MSLPATALEAVEHERLTTLEATIERGLDTFVEVGTALGEIRDARFYRFTHDTFEAYLSDRWEMSRRRGYQLIEGAEVVALMGTNVHTPPIATEAVARELASLAHSDPGAAQEAYSAAVETSGGKPTAAVVRQVVRQMAAESEAELQEATAHWTREQKAAVAPERMRQQGEFMRLTEDLSALPDPVGFARSHRDLNGRVMSRAEAAHAWLSDFLSEWRHGHGV